MFRSMHPMPLRLLCGDRCRGRRRDGEAGWNPAGSAEAIFAGSSNVTLDSLTVEPANEPLANRMSFRCS